MSTRQSDNGYHPSPPSQGAQGFTVCCCRSYLPDSIPEGSSTLFPLCCVYRENRTSCKHTSNLLCCQQPGPPAKDIIFFLLVARPAHVAATISIQLSIPISSGFVCFLLSTIRKLLESGAGVGGRSWRSEPGHESDFIPVSLALMVIHGISYCITAFNQIGRASCRERV